MKKCLLTVFCLFLMPWSIAHAQEGSYTPEDLNGDYGTITYLMGQIVVDEPIPIDSKDKGAILDPIMMEIAKARIDWIQSLQFQEGINRLKMDYEASRQIKDGVISMLSPGTESLTQTIVADGPSDHPIFPVKSDYMTLDNATYIILDQYDVYLVGVQGTPDSQQTLTIEVLGQKDHVLLNDQIDEPLYTPFLPDDRQVNENGYQTVPYEELLSLPQGQTLNVLVKGRVKEIIDQSDESCRFILQSDQDDNLYFIYWFGDQVQPLSVDDKVTVEGGYGGPTEDNLPFINSGNFNQVIIEE